MNLKRKFCPNDCDLRSYYINQAGRGLSDIRIFRGNPYQAGYGLGTFFSKYGIPVLKFLGKHLLSTGVSVGSDIMADRNIKDSIKSRMKEGSRTFAKDGLSKLSDFVDQYGTGRLYKVKRRRIARKNKSKGKKATVKKLRKTRKRKKVRNLRSKISDIFS